MAFAASFLVAYVPFWLQGTAADFAGLAEFAKDWEFNSSIYALARLASGTQAAKVICALIFFAAWVLLWWRWNKSFMSPAASNRMPPGALIYGALFLTSTTVNPWYLQWLIPFVAVEPGLIGFTAMALVSLSYVTGLNAGISALGNFEHPIWVRIVEYGGITLTAMIQGWRWNEERSTKCAAREPQ
jgi:hypothetical protein